MWTVNHCIVRSGILIVGKLATSACDLNYGCGKYNYQNIRNVFWCMELHNARSIVCIRPLWNHIPCSGKCHCWCDIVWWKCILAYMYLRSVKPIWQMCMRMRRLVILSSPISGKTVDQRISSFAALDQKLRLAQGTLAYIACMYLVNVVTFYYSFVE